MKFNWGTGITIAIIAFMGFILFMVFQAFQTNADLYAVDYYDQETAYQEKIDAKNNAKTLKGELSITQNEDYVVIEYPLDFIGNTTEGTINFFRPNDAKLDIDHIILPMENKQLISKRELVAGNYMVKLDWKMNGLTYFLEQKIVVN